MEFGKMPPRPSQVLAYANPVLGPVYMAKYNLSDGFCWPQFSLDSILPLAALLPMPQGEEPLVALLLAVTMGWTEALPSFTSTTEIATDLANWSLASGKILGPHHLEQSAEPDHAT